MTLLDAKEYDPEKGRKRTRRIISIVAIVVIVLGLVWWFRYWPQEHVVGNFFSDLKEQNFKAAYGLWMHDPSWEQHPQAHAKYGFNDFYRDWGPGGEWGLIKTYKVYGASTCPGPSSGVVVDVIVNDRTEHAQVWVEKSDKTFSYPPCELVFH
ncbi:MAG TPA: hypothetical protein VMB66_17060 [Candidatus Acidoferrales bacterium]|jgi:hypothetical protein|nr:hypothetical protein [Candidatus Acidoferrales bacterium]